jgi:hypothetical protein
MLSTTASATLKESSGTAASAASDIAVWTVYGHSKWLIGSSGKPMNILFFNPGDVDCP